ncbi:tRNA1(Val) (adenine(37)-N6)-methyltransferase [Desulfovibrio inopinatus]|uniref:tRNA1(Val) (adenine(37)-N6)-methyltransferase n=1 Tax=Desulfovibrio inopinatus TaxID=102109 RepID=UPI0003F67C93|nr:methyltransferase [Desulfovibrio inopinatus]
MLFPDIPESNKTAREAFPRGLHQPEGRFRFGIDALLLACFSSIKSSETLVDLGTGCGAAGLGLLLHHAKSKAQVIGIDCDLKMTLAAQANADHLGLSKNFFALAADVRDIASKRTIKAETIDRVIANPPYRKSNQGRSSANAARAAARFEHTAQLRDFIAAAAFLVKNKGAVSIVMLAERLQELFIEMNTVRLTPKRLCCVHGHDHAESRLVLVEAIKNARPGLRIEPPLILYEKGITCSQISSQALEFCPFLACNARQPSHDHHTEKSTR